MKIMVNILWAMALSLTLAPLTISAETPREGEIWRPNGPIRLIISFRAGGGADTQARMIADVLQRTNGWDVIPQQVTGKGGLNALREIIQAPADGTTIALVVTETLGYTLAAADGIDLTPRDITPLITSSEFEMGLVARTDRRWKTLHDVLASAKDGVPLRMGVMGPKLADMAYLLAEANDLNLNIVDLRGGKASLDAVLAEDIDLGFMAGIQSRGVAAGHLVNLASIMSKPLTQSPDAPLLSEFGVEFTMEGYFVFIAPKDLPEAAKSTLSNALAEAVNTPEIAEFLEKSYGGPVIVKGQELDDWLDWAFTDAQRLIDLVQ